MVDPAVSYILGTTCCPEGSWTLVSFYARGSTIQIQGCSGAPGDGSHIFLFPGGGGLGITEVGIFQKCICKDNNNVTIIISRQFVPFICRPL